MSYNMKNPPKNLGDRKDFWNTKFNPITGYLVDLNWNKGQRDNVVLEHRAEYNFNVGR